MCVRDHWEHSLFTMLISPLWLCWDRADGRIIFCLQWLQICWYHDNHSNIRCGSTARQLERRINHSTARHMAGKLWPSILRIISPVNSNPTRLQINIYANMYTYYIHMKLCKDAAVKNGLVLFFVCDNFCNLIFTSLHCRQLNIDLQTIRQR